MQNFDDWFSTDKESIILALLVLVLFLLVLCHSATGSLDPGCSSSFTGEAEIKEIFIDIFLHASESSKTRFEALHTDETTVVNCPRDYIFFSGSKGLEKQELILEWRRNVFKTIFYQYIP